MVRLRMGLIGPIHNWQGCELSRRFMEIDV